ncbi:hypothetical protein [Cytobacillus firmus]|uniref:hypothetical protein n=1 Tax=Cytobacillus firmus TaxID=1399 RepID=UPI0018CF9711|nr:hypothetical protein [Cytobacillus firmus]MBG9587207.1 hypothetical protein [Cytobacillus firmus]MBG9587259.1 hypothetical protein [Cytobacillus firmus]MBG9587265.1 hypothetical protein [Cytobacillus firmus]MBG9587605.1 hypothetical protein [Cytobacillus firmus]
MKLHKVTGAAAVCLMAANFLAAPSYADVIYEYDENNQIQTILKDQTIKIDFLHDNNGNLTKQNVTRGYERVLKLEAKPKGTDMVTTTPTLEKGKTYVYKYKIYFAQPADTYNGLFWWNTYTDPSDPRNEDYFIPKDADTSQIGEWQEVTGTFTVPTDETYEKTHLSFRGHSDNDGFKFYIDDFELSEQDVPENKVIDTDFDEMKEWTHSYKYENTVKPELMEFKNQALFLEGEPYGTSMIRKEVALEPGKNYTYSYKVLFFKPAERFNGLFWYDLHTDGTRTEDVLAVPADPLKIGEWQEVSGSFTASTDPLYDKTRLLFRGHSESSDFRFYIDDFKLHETDHPETPILSETFDQLESWTASWDYGNLTKPKSVELFKNVLKLEAEPQGTSRIIQEVALEPGKEYIYRYKLHLKNPAEAYNGLYWYHTYSDPNNPDHKKYYIVNKHDLTQTGKWQEITGTLTAPADVQYQKTAIALRGHSENGEFEFYIDDLSIYEKGNPGNIVLNEGFDDLFNWSQYQKDGNALAPVIYNFEQKQPKITGQASVAAASAEAKTGKAKKETDSGLTDQWSQIKEFFANLF